MRKGKNSLALQTTIAAAWSAVAFLATRFTSLANQLAIAYFLIPGELGAVAFAGSLSLLGEMMQANGIGEVLLRRKKPSLWFSSATMLCLGLGGTAMLVVAATGLIVNITLNNQLVCGLMLVNSLKFPLREVAVVPRTALRHAFRFREVSLINALAALSIMLFTVALAAIGFGAFSIVIPWVVAEAIKAICYFRFAGVQIDWRPRLSRMRHLLLSGNVHVGIGNFSLQITQHFDYLLLGLFYSPAVLGLYYFAFNFSTQIAQAASTLITENLQVTLSSVADDSERQFRGFVRGCKVIAAVGMPLCVLQFVLAGELIQLVFKEKWYGSILFLQILSCAMGFRLIAITCVRFLVSQGRYSRFMNIAIANALVFILAISLGAIFSKNGTGVAIATAAYSVLLSFVYLRVALPKERGSQFLSTAWEIFAFPIIASFTVLPLTKWLIQSTESSDLLTILATCVIGVLAYLVNFRIFSPNVWMDIASPFGKLLSSRLSALR